ncbi:MAG: SdrD B-like domain-containing protein, partial [Pirellulales bacterium]
DPKFAGYPIDLPADNHNGFVNRTDGALVHLQQQPLPITISGTVFKDPNLTNHQDAGEPGIGGVELTLYQLVGQTYVATGQTATTDASGDYRFAGAYLVPGTYKIVETQPQPDWFSVGASAGNVGGSTRGVVESVDVLSDIVLLGGEDSVDNDFAEALPGSLSGIVFIDANDNGIRDAGEEGIGGVTLQLLNSSGQQTGRTATSSTDAATLGHYVFNNLLPGSYGVAELQPAAFDDGKDQVGSAGGAALAQPGDRITGAGIGSEGHAVNYNFGELIPPGSISGFVFSDRDRDCVFDLNESPIAGVKIDLLDANGNVLRTVETDIHGQYVFDNLAPGIYAVREHQPVGFFHGGQVVGSGTGVVAGDDHLAQIQVRSRVALVNYNFCELPPGSISGFVHSDPDRDCVFDSSETPIKGVQVDLLDAQGHVLRTVETDVNGRYEFDGLEPGIYAVREHQPDGFFHGGQVVGSGTGTIAGDDWISAIDVTPGSELVDYNFCELPPARLAGRVYADPDQDCVQTGTEPGLAGVRIDLLDEQGILLATTFTDALGNYEFADLEPNRTYQVFEHQPATHFHGGHRIGNTPAGTLGDSDTISGITLAPGESRSELNFCEIPPITISGYVFQDGPPIRISGAPLTHGELLRDGLRTADDAPIAGVVLTLLQGLGADVFEGEHWLPGAYGPAGLVAATDARGYYEFRNLRPGAYSVYETHPEGFIDSLETAGTTGGVALNRTSTGGRPIILRDARFHAIVLISASRDSLENNFSEVRTEPGDFVLPRIVPVIPPPPLTVVIPAPRTELPFSPLLSIIDRDRLQSTRARGYTWHLSVINAGNPRGTQRTEDALVQAITTRLDVQAFAAAKNLKQSTWSLGAQRETARRVLFGMKNGLPVVGDFNGDGVSDLGVFDKGAWFLDLNGNGIWDDGDLWAKLGAADDRPVTGDWDGDGKDDIGIFGPAWAGDPRAISLEPGLPDPMNRPTGAKKNVPPALHQAAMGMRTLKLTSQGKPRADLIDHVFHYGVATDVPLTGDWNGDGIASIGIFRNGTWRLDANGDGKWSNVDSAFDYGQRGDLPVAGDFNGDGVSEVGVYRAGKWFLDTNNNHRLDAEDRTFDLGGPADQPVVGDWDGDGTDEPGLYQAGPAATARPSPQ